MATFRDIANLPEDDRIQQIGEYAMTGKKVGFIVDDEPGKADRYIRKLAARFPKIVVDKRMNGPVPGTVSITVKRMAEG